MLKTNICLLIAIVCWVGAASAQNDESAAIPPTLTQPDTEHESNPLPKDKQSPDVESQENGSVEASDGSAKAEVSSVDSFDPIAEKTSSKLLNEDTPDWVKEGLLVGDERSFAISSSLFSSLEQCREDLKARMMSEVCTYLNKHVLEHVEAESLTQLDAEYVEKYWVNSKQVFDNVRQREGVVDHQLWIGLHIDAGELDTLRKWERMSVREQRTKHVGVLGGIGIGTITLLSGLIGFMARREKAKLKA